MAKYQDILNYNRIASAIDFVQQNYRQQPSLAEIASHVHVSPEHFQRVFQEWAGISPKKFLQYIGIQHAKRLLATEQSTLFDTSFALGLSSTSRLHDMFVHIEGMTPAAYKNGGQNLDISYGIYPTLFGLAIIASTEKGICFVAFDDEEKSLEKQLVVAFPNANFAQQQHPMHEDVLSFLKKDWHDLPEIKLHLKGTPFQLKVWESLLKIPAGKLSTYTEIASAISHEKGARAVGNAIGSNPIAYLIPCHRVIQSSGLISGYRWGTTRKAAIIGWESALTYQEQDETI